MQPSSFDRFLWAATLCGDVALLGVLWRRGRARSFPVFTTWIVFNVARTIALYFFLHDLPDKYDYAYWSLEAVDQGLQVLVLYELALKVFRPTGVWARDVARPFAEMAGVCAAVALALTWLAAPHSSTWLRAIVLRESFFPAALLSELFVGMLALSVTWGLPWKTHVARIAQGMGAFSMVCLARDAVANYLGNEAHAYTVLSHLRILVYLSCEGYWIAMLWQEAPAPRELPDSMLTQVYALQRQVEYDLARVRNWRRS